MDQTKVDGAAKVYLGKSGMRFWEDMAELVPEMDPPTKVLVFQAARMIDHLERLDRILRSKETWISLANEGFPNDEGKITIVMDGALSEFRQQANTLSAIFNKLGIGKIDPDLLLTGKTVTESRASELARQRADRLEAAKNPQ